MTRKDFFDRYDIDIQNGKLGGGAFGTVYKVYDDLRDQWKAVKIAEVKYIDGKEFSLISEFESSKAVPLHKNISSGGTQRYTGSNEVTQVAVFEQTSTSIVGKIKANNYGLYDMLGNVAEWCADDYADTFGGVNSSKYIVVKGGSYRE